MGIEWTRVNAGHYVSDNGCEIVLICSRWHLTHPYQEETTHRTLREAKAAADNV